MTSTLWTHDSFINPNIPFVFNKEITEYDMKEAGFSLTKEFQLLDKDTIKKLEKYPKDQRKIRLGVIQREDEKYRENLKNAFKDARKVFFEINEIEDSDIISIKKDAILTMKRCKTTKLGEFIEFRPKHFYTSYIQLDKKLEFYYSPNELDVKGISDEMLDYHKEYMIKFIKQFFKKMETEEDVDVIEFTRRFIDKYKRRELEVGYYRSFDHNGYFIVPTEPDKIYTDYWEDQKEDLDISYNFQNILLKLIRIPL